MSAKSSASSSPCSSKDNSPNKLEFVVGNRLEAMDYMCNWYVSKIAKVDHKKKKILIHFEGWNSRYDEWVSFDSKKIRALPKEKVKSKIKVKEFKQWKEGEMVSAKWSDGTYYPAKIVKVISKDFYEVEYDDGFQKIIHQSKIRDQDITNKQKKPVSKSMYQPLRKAQLAQDRASRARRRSGKDSGMLSPTSNETTELTEAMKEMEKQDEESKELEKKDEGSKELEKKDEGSKELEKKDEGSKEMEKKDEGSKELEKKDEQSKELEKKDEQSKEIEKKGEGSKELEKKDEGNEQPKATSEDNIRSSRKRKRRESDKSQEYKCAKIEETESKSTSAKVEPVDQSKQSVDKTEDSKESLSSVSPSNENETAKTTESQSETKVSPMVTDDDLLPAENSIRVTHIKEKSQLKCSKRSVTSPLSVEVEPKTDICQVIIPDKDMKILQSTGVLGLLNVQEPCVIMGTSLADTNTTTSAAEEVLSKCKIPARVTTEEKPVVLSPRENLKSVAKVGRDKIKEKQNPDKKSPSQQEEPSKKKPKSDSNELPKDVDRAGALDSKGSDGTSKDLKESNIEEGLGVKQDIDTRKKEEIDETLERTKSLLDHEESCSKKDRSVVEEDVESQHDALKSVNEPGEATDHAQKSVEDRTKSKPPTSEVNSFKAKRLRLDQITGKLSIQRQTQMTAKREVIKQKLDNLKSEEITKSARVSPPGYQQISPNPPPYPCVSAPAPRMNPQYVERYPAPTLLTYGAPNQCTGPCCAYPPGNSYPPASSCRYCISPGGMPHETYVVYGPGGQTSYPVMGPTITPAPCSCCSLYPTVLHESGHQGGPPLVRLMPVEQRPLPGTVVYKQTADPKALSPRGISPRGISPDGRKMSRTHKKAEQESGMKQSARQDNAGFEGKHGIRSEDKKHPSKSPKGKTQPKPPDGPDERIAKYRIPKLNPLPSKSNQGTPTKPPNLNLTTHLSAHLTKKDSTPMHSKTSTPSHSGLDPDDLPLSRLVSSSTPGDNTPDGKVPVGTKSLGIKTPESSPSDGVSDVPTPLPAEGQPGKVLKRRHVFAPKELRIELDHNKFKCEHPDCDKSFRKASLLESHVKYYHTSPLDNKRKRSSASWSEEDSFESKDSAHPKRRTKRQSTSDVSIGSVGDLSVEAQSPTASDIHVEVEHDVDDEEMDISDHKEEDVVRCLCGVYEDSGLMIQCEQCYTWQHSECVISGQEHVPTKYLCYVCKNPPGQRKNARYKNNYDWFKRGVLPSFVPHQENEVKIVQAQITHCLISDIHTLNSELKGMKRKIHILRTPNHADLKMWEHKQDMYEDDSLRSGSEISKDESSLSEVNEQDNTEGVPQNGNTMRVAREPHDATFSRNAQNENGENETKNSEELTDNKDVHKLREEQTPSVEQEREDLTNAEQTVQESKHPNTTQERDITTKEQQQSAQDSKDSSRLNNDPERDEKNSVNDLSVSKISPCEGERVAEKMASHVGATENNNDVVKGGNDEPLVKRKDSIPDQKNSVKYSGDDLAFVNLLEEIEDDQSFFDEQLDRLEKQVEILEKSFTTAANERRPSIRKLAKQLSKLQKLGFVC